MNHRAVARLAFYARLAIALACFQLSGYGHLVTDALASAGMIENHDDDCQDEAAARQAVRRATAFTA